MKALLSTFGSAGPKATDALTRLLDPRTAAPCGAAAERLGRRDGLDRAAALIDARLAAATPGAQPPMQARA